MTSKTDFDICVIGGGINGTGIARDAAGRGLSVILLEAGDLAQATSSASTKLIHGGLRYLEHYEFRLVAESVNERERLLRSAPHIIRPLEFILPHEPQMRPAWLIRLGLFLYDRLGRRTILPGSRGVELSGGPLKESYRKGFSYYDCRVEDSRLVVLNARDAADKGAVVKTRAPVTALKPEEQAWHITYGDGRAVRAKMAVNAAGPWVRSLLEANTLAHAKVPKVRLVRGSHIVVPRLYEGAHAYTLQQPDGRVVFAIPYEQTFTLIGTTDTEHEGDPGRVNISEEEIDYLCAAVNRSFKKQIGPQVIQHHYSGVRPLLDSGDQSLSKVTRDYELVLDTLHGPPLLSVFGGKLTTCRALSAQAVDMLAGDKKSWTETAILPGGDMPDSDFEGFFKTKCREYAQIPEDLLYRLCRAYGTRADIILKNPGAHYGDHVYEGEIRYLVRTEWARTAEDILWRRSKLGLHISGKTKENLEKALPQILKEEQGYE